MERNFVRSVNYVLEREGGFVNDPADPGGATNRGITIGALRAWRKAPVSVEDVRKLDRSEAVSIYHARYWTVAWCDALPAGVDLLVFDAGVNSGIRQALTTLERRMGFGIPPRPDAHAQHRQREQGSTWERIERPLLARLQTACIPAVICGYCEQRRLFYRSLRAFPHFGAGWLRRVNQTQQLAMHLWAVRNTGIV